MADASAYSVHYSFRANQQLVIMGSIYFMVLVEHQNLTQQILCPIYLDDRLNVLDNLLIPGIHAAFRIRLEIQQ